MRGTLESEIFGSIFINERYSLHTNCHKLVLAVYLVAHLLYAVAFVMLGCSFLLVFFLTLRSSIDFVF